MRYVLCIGCYTFAFTSESCQKRLKPSLDLTFCKYFLRKLSPRPVPAEHFANKYILVGKESKFHAIYLLSYFFRRFFEYGKSDEWYKSAVHI
jgi:hypothetical protein